MNIYPGGDLIELILTCLKRHRSFFAILLQACAILIIWLGLKGIRSNTMIISFGGVVVIYTLIFYLFTKSENSYILWLAIFDVIVLWILMALTDNIKSPFSGVLLTIPILTYLLGLHPSRTTVVFICIAVTIVIPYCVPSANKIILYFVSSANKNDIPLSKFFWITLVCLAIIGIASLAGYAKDWKKANSVEEESFSHINHKSYK